MLWLYNLILASQLSPDILLPPSLFLLSSCLLLWHSLPNKQHTEGISEVYTRSRADLHQWFWVPLMNNRRLDSFFGTWCPFFCNYALFFFKSANSYKWTFLRDWLLLFLCAMFSQLVPTFIHWWFLLQWSNTSVWAYTHWNSLLPRMATSSKQCWQLWRRCLGSASLEMIWLPAT